MRAMDDVTRAEALVERMAGSPDGLGELDAAQSALLLAHFQTPPAELQRRCRIAHAARRLAAGARVDGETAAGFAGAMGMSAAAYRELAGARAFALALPPGYAIGRALAYLGREADSLTIRVDGHDFAAGLRLGGTPALLRATMSRGQVRAEIEAAGKLPDGAAFLAHALLLRLLGLHRPPEPFEAHAAARPEIAPLLAGQRGLRIPQTADPFDGLVWVILGQQITLGFAFTLRRRLVALAGTPVGGSGLYAPPAAEAVANLSLEALLPEQFSRRKAEYLIGAARRIVAGELAIDRPAWASATRIERELLAVRGLGPWSVHYLLMRAYGFEDCVPVGDAGLTKALMHFFALPARPGPAETLALLAPFAPYRSWATFHLWESLKIRG
jgi:AraC family transcriptional regulator of adaptative response / DNA-3-methyladenine glycosylase II